MCEVGMCHENNGKIAAMQVYKIYDEMTNCLSNSSSLQHFELKSCRYSNFGKMEGCIILKCKQ